MESDEDVERRQVNNNENDVARISPMWDDYDNAEWGSWLIPIFVGINVIMFLVTMLVNNCPSHNNNNNVNGRSCVARFLGRVSFEPLRYNPLLGPGPHALLKMGAINWSAVVEHHQGWRLITSIWLHSGLIDLLVNMFCLLFVGIRIENLYGFLRVGIIYLLSGIGGNITSCLFYSKHICVGPSSALLGLIGAMFSDLLTNWTRYSNKACAVITLLFMFAINLILTIVPHPHNGGPIGGFAVGFLLGFILLVRPRVGWFPSIYSSKSKYKPYQYILGIVSLVLLIIVYVIGLVMVFKN
ncbi:hypothetical protein BVRB_3g066290 [Beta vulgaris subsp. vulgaris]|nr:hypothetical protein BVRB_3g066290 [Beta vulgaris subsp. vulgaris]